MGKQIKNEGLQGAVQQRTENEGRPVSGNGYFELISQGVDPIKVAENGTKLRLESYDQVKSVYGQNFTDPNTGEFNEQDFDKMYKSANSEVDYYNSINYDDLKQTTTYKLGKLWGFKDPTRTVLQNSGIAQETNFLNPTTRFPQYHRLDTDEKIATKKGYYRDFNEETGEWKLKKITWQDKVNPVTPLVLKYREDKNGNIEPMWEKLLIGKNRTEAETIYSWFGSNERYGGDGLSHFFGGLFNGAIAGTLNSFAWMAERTMGQAPIGAPLNVDKLQNAYEFSPEEYQQLLSGEEIAKQYFHNNSGETRYMPFSFDDAKFMRLNEKTGNWEYKESTGTMQSAMFSSLVTLTEQMKYKPAAAKQEGVLEDSGSFGDKYFWGDLGDGIGFMLPMIIGAGAVTKLIPASTKMVQKAPSIISRLTKGTKVVSKASSKGTQVVKNIPKMVNKSIKVKHNLARGTMTYMGTQAELAGVWKEGKESGLTDRDLSSVMITASPSIMAAEWLFATPRYLKAFLPSKFGVDRAIKNNVKQIAKLSEKMLYKGSKHEAIKRITLNNLKHQSVAFMKNAPDLVRQAQNYKVGAFVYNTLRAGSGEMIQENLEEHYIDITKGIYDKRWAEEYAVPGMGKFGVDMTNTWISVPSLWGSREWWERTKEVAKISFIVGGLFGANAKTKSMDYGVDAIVDHLIKNGAEGIDAQAAQLKKMHKDLWQKGQQGRNDKDFNNMLITNEEGGTSVVAAENIEGLEAGTPLSNQNDINYQLQIQQIDIIAEMIKESGIADVNSLENFVGKEQMAKDYWTHFVELRNVQDQVKEIEEQLKDTKLNEQEKAALEVQKNDLLNGSSKELQEMEEKYSLKNGEITPETTAKVKEEIGENIHLLYNRLLGIRANYLKLKLGDKHESSIVGLQERVNGYLEKRPGEKFSRKYIDALRLDIFKKKFNNKYEASIPMDEMTYGRMNAVIQIAQPLREENRRSVLKDRAERREKSQEPLGSVRESLKELFGEDINKGIGSINKTITLEGLKQIERALTSINKEKSLIETGINKEDAGYVLELNKLANKLQERLINEGNMELAMSEEMGRITSLTGETNKIKEIESGYTVQDDANFLMKVLGFDVLKAFQEEIDLNNPSIPRHIQSAENVIIQYQQMSMFNDIMNVMKKGELSKDEENFLDEISYNQLMSDMLQDKVEGETLSEVGRVINEETIKAINEELKNLQESFDTFKENYNATASQRAEKETKKRHVNTINRGDMLRELQSWFSNISDNGEVSEMSKVNASKETIVQKLKSITFPDGKNLFDLLFDPGTGLINNKIFPLLEELKAEYKKVEDLSEEGQSSLLYNDENILELERKTKEAIIEVESLLYKAYSEFGIEEMSFTNEQGTVVKENIDLKKAFFTEAMEAFLVNCDAKLGNLEGSLYNSGNSNTYFAEENELINSQESLIYDDNPTRSSFSYMQIETHLNTILNLDMNEFNKFKKKEAKNISQGNGNVQHIWTIEQENLIAAGIAFIKSKGKFIGQKTPISDFGPSAVTDIEYVYLFSDENFDSNPQYLANNVAKLLISGYSGSGKTQMVVPMLVKFFEGNTNVEFATTAPGQISDTLNNIVKANTEQADVAGYDHKSLLSDKTLAEIKFKAKEDNQVVLILDEAAKLSREQIDKLGQLRNENVVIIGLGDSTQSSYLSTNKKGILEYDVMGVEFSRGAYNVPSITTKHRSNNIEQFQLLETLSNAIRKIKTGTEISNVILKGTMDNLSYFKDAEGRKSGIEFKKTAEDVITEFKNSKNNGSSALVFALKAEADAFKKENPELADRVKYILTDAKGLEVNKEDSNSIQGQEYDNVYIAFEYKDNGDFNKIGKDTVDKGSMNKFQIKNLVTAIGRLKTNSKGDGYLALPQIKGIGSSNQVAKKSDIPVVLVEDLDIDTLDKNTALNEYIQSINPEQKYLDPNAKEVNKKSNPKPSDNSDDSGFVKYDVVNYKGEIYYVVGKTNDNKLKLLKLDDLSLNNPIEVLSDDVTIVDSNLYTDIFVNDPVKNISPVFVNNHFRLVNGKIKFDKRKQRTREIEKANLVLNLIAKLDEGKNVKLQLKKAVRNKKIVLYAEYEGKVLFILHTGTHFRNTFNPKQIELFHKAKSKKSGEVVGSATISRETLAKTFINNVKDTVNDNPKSLDDYLMMINEFNKSGSGITFQIKENDKTEPLFERTGDKKKGNFNQRIYIEVYKDGKKLEGRDTFVYFDTNMNEGFVEKIKNETFGEWGILDQVTSDKKGYISNFYLVTNTKTDILGETLRQNRSRFVNIDKDGNMTIKDEFKKYFKIKKIKRGVYTKEQIDFRIPDGTTIEGLKKYVEGVVELFDTMQKELFIPISMQEATKDYEKLDTKNVTVKYTPTINDFSVELSVDESIDPPSNDKNIEAERADMERRRQEEIDKLQKRYEEEVAEIESNRQEYPKTIPLNSKGEPMYGGTSIYDNAMQAAKENLEYAKSKINSKYNEPEIKTGTEAKPVQKESDIEAKKTDIEIRRQEAKDNPVNEPISYKKAVDEYKSTELGSSENAKTKKDNLVKEAETKEGKSFVENQVAQLEHNDDGTITVYRSGTMQEGHNPATTSKKTAEIIASERKKQGLSSDIIEVRVNPSDISVVVPGIESEVFINVDKNNKERINENTKKEQKTKDQLLLEKREIENEIEKTKKALANAKKDKAEGTFKFSNNVYNDIVKKQEAKIKNLEWQLKKYNAELAALKESDIEAKKDKIKRSGTKTKTTPNVGVKSWGNGLSGIPLFDFDLRTSEEFRRLTLPGERIKYLSETQARSLVEKILGKNIANIGFFNQSSNLLGFVRGLDMMLSYSADGNTIEDYKVRHEVMHIIFNSLDFETQSELLRQAEELMTEEQKRFYGNIKNGTIEFICDSFMNKTNFEKNYKRRYRGFKGLLYKFVDFLRSIFNNKSKKIEFDTFLNDVYFGEYSLDNKIANNVTENYNPNMSIVQEDNRFNETYYLEDTTQNSDKINLEQLRQELEEKEDQDIVTLLNAFNNSSETLNKVLTGTRRGILKNTGYNTSIKDNPVSFNEAKDKFYEDLQSNPDYAIYKEFFNPILQDNSLYDILVERAFPNLTRKGKIKSVEKAGRDVMNLPINFSRSDILDLVLSSVQYKEYTVSKEAIPSNKFIDKTIVDDIFISALNNIHKINGFVSINDFLNELQSMANICKSKSNLENDIVMSKTYNTIMSILDIFGPKEVDSNNIEGITVYNLAYQYKELQEIFPDYKLNIKAKREYAEQLFAGIISSYSNKQPNYVRGTIFSENGKIKMTEQIIGSRDITGGKLALFKQKMFGKMKTSGGTNGYSYSLYSHANTKKGIQIFGTNGEIEIRGRENKLLLVQNEDGSFEFNGSGVNKTQNALYLLNLLGLNLTYNAVSSMIVSESAIGEARLAEMTANMLFANEHYLSNNLKQENNYKNQTRDYEQRKSEIDERFEIVQKYIKDNEINLADEVGPAETENENNPSEDLVTFTPEITAASLYDDIREVVQFADAINKIAFKNQTINANGDMIPLVKLASIIDDVVYFKEKESYRNDLKQQIKNRINSNQSENSPIIIGEKHLLEEAKALGIEPSAEYNGNIIAFNSLFNGNEPLLEIKEFKSILDIGNKFKHIKKSDFSTNNWIDVFLFNFFFNSVKSRKGIDMVASNFADSKYMPIFKIKGLEKSISFNEETGRLEFNPKVIYKMISKNFIKARKEQDISIRKWEALVSFLNKQGGGKTLPKINLLRKAFSKLDTKKDQIKDIEEISKNLSNMKLDFNLMNDFAKFGMREGADYQIIKRDDGTSYLQLGRVTLMDNSVNDPIYTFDNYKRLHEAQKEGFSSIDSLMKEMFKDNMFELSKEVSQNMSYNQFPFDIDQQFNQDKKYEKTSYSVVRKVKDTKAEYEYSSFFYAAELLHHIVSKEIDNLGMGNSADYANANAMSKAQKSMATGGSKASLGTPNGAAQFSYAVDIAEVEISGNVKEALDGQELMSRLGGIRIRNSFGFLFDKTDHRMKNVRGGINPVTGTDGFVKGSQKMFTGEEAEMFHEFVIPFERKMMNVTPEMLGLDTTDTIKVLSEEWSWLEKEEYNTLTELFDELMGQYNDEVGSGKYGLNYEAVINTINDFITDHIVESGVDYRNRFITSLNPTSTLKRKSDKVNYARLFPGTESNNLMPNFLIIGEGEFVPVLNIRDNSKLYSQQNLNSEKEESKYGKQLENLMALGSKTNAELVEKIEIINSQNTENGLNKLIKKVKSDPEGMVKATNLSQGQLNYQTELIAAGGAILIPQLMSVLNSAMGSMVNKAIHGSPMFGGKYEQTSGIFFRGAKKDVGLRMYRGLNSNGEEVSIEEADIIAPCQIVKNHLQTDLFNIKKGEKLSDVFNIKIGNTAFNLREEIRKNNYKVKDAVSGKILMNEAIWQNEEAREYAINKILKQELESTKDGEVIDLSRIGQSSKTEINLKNRDLIAKQLTDYYNTFSKTLFGVLVRTPTPGTESAARYEQIEFTWDTGNSLFIPEELMGIDNADYDGDTRSVYQYKAAKDKKNNYYFENNQDFINSKNVALKNITDDALNNTKLNLYEEYYKDKKNYNVYTNVLSTKRLEENEIVKENDRGLKVNTLSSAIKAFKGANLNDKMIARLANSLTVGSRLFKLKSLDPKIKDYLKLKLKYDVSETETSIDNIRISLQAALDGVKKDILSLFNLNETNQNMFVAMVLEGNSMESVIKTVSNKDGLLFQTMNFLARNNTLASFEKTSLPEALNQVVAKYNTEEGLPEDIEMEQKKILDYYYKGEALYRLSRVFSIYGGKKSGLYHQRAITKDIEFILGMKLDKFLEQANSKSPKFEKNNALIEEHFNAFKEDYRNDALKNDEKIRNMINIPLVVSKFNNIEAFLTALVVEQNLQRDVNFRALDIIKEDVIEGIIKDQKISFVDSTKYYEINNGIEGFFIDKFFREKGKTIDMSFTGLDNFKGLSFDLRDINHCDHFVVLFADYIRSLKEDEHQVNQSVEEIKGSFFLQNISFDEQTGRLRLDVGNVTEKKEIVTKIQKSYDEIQNEEFKEAFELYSFLVYGSDENNFSTAVIARMNEGNMAIKYGEFLKEIDRDMRNDTSKTYKEVKAFMKDNIILAKRKSLLSHEKGNQSKYENGAYYYPKSFDENYHIKDIEGNTITVKQTAKTVRIKSGESLRHDSIVLRPSDPDVVRSIAKGDNIVLTMNNVDMIEINDFVTISDVSYKVENIEPVGEGQYKMVLNKEDNPRTNNESLRTRAMQSNINAFVEGSLNKVLNKDKEVGVNALTIKIENRGSDKAVTQKGRSYIINSQSLNSGTKLVSFADLISNIEGNGNKYALFIKGVLGHGDTIGKNIPIENAYNIHFKKPLNEVTVLELANALKNGIVVNNEVYAAELDKSATKDYEIVTDANIAINEELKKQKEERVAKSKEDVNFINTIIPAIDALNTVSVGHKISDLVGKQKSIEFANNIMKRLKAKTGLDYSIISIAEAKRMGVSGARGFFKNWKVYLVAELMSLDTPFHEVLHPIISQIQKKNPKLHKSLVAEMNDLYANDTSVRNLLDQVEKSYKGENQSDLINEKLITLISGYAGGRVEITYNHGFKNKVKQLFQWIWNTLFNKKSKDIGGINEMPSNFRIKDMVDLMFDDTQLYVEKTITNEAFGWQNIKPGVEQLFNSNPELANQVYEALGFDNNNQSKIADIEKRRQEELRYWQAEDRQKRIKEGRETTKKMLENIKKKYSATTFQGIAIRLLEKIIDFNHFAIINSEGLKLPGGQDATKFGALATGEGMAMRQDRIDALLEGDVNAVKTFIHELVHTFTKEKVGEYQMEKSGLIPGYKAKLTEKERKAVAELERIYNKVKQQFPSSTEYGLTNLDEFLAEAFSNGSFQGTLKELKSEGKTTSLFKEWLNAISDFFYESLVKWSKKFNKTIPQKSEITGILEDIMGWTEDLVGGELLKLEVTTEEINAKYDVELKSLEITPQQKQQALQAYSQYLQQNPNGNIEGFKNFISNKTLFQKESIQTEKIFLSKDDINSDKQKNQYADNVTNHNFLNYLLTDNETVNNDNFVVQKIKARAANALLQQMRKNKGSVNINGQENTSLKRKFEVYWNEMNESVKQRRLVDLMKSIEKELVPEYLGKKKNTVKNIENFLNSYEGVEDFSQENIENIFGKEAAQYMKPSALQQLVEILEMNGNAKIKKYSELESEYPDCYDPNFDFDELYVIIHHAETINGKTSMNASFVVMDLYNNYNYKPGGRVDNNIAGKFITDKEAKDLGLSEYSGNYGNALKLQMSLITMRMRTLNPDVKIRKSGLVNITRDTASYNENSMYVSVEALRKLTNIEEFKKGLNSELLKVIEDAELIDKNTWAREYVDILVHSLKSQKEDMQRQGKDTDVIDYYLSQVTLLKVGELEPSQLIPVLRDRKAYLDRLHNNSHNMLYTNEEYMALVELLASYEGRSNVKLFDPKNLKDSTIFDYTLKNVRDVAHPIMQNYFTRLLDSANQATGQMRVAFETELRPINEEIIKIQKELGIYRKGRLFDTGERIWGRLFMKEKIKDHNGREVEVNLKRIHHDMKDIRTIEAVRNKEVSEEEVKVGAKIVKLLEKYIKGYYRHNLLFTNKGGYSPYVYFDKTQKKKVIKEDELKKAIDEQYETQWDPGLMPCFTKDINEHFVKGQVASGLSKMWKRGKQVGFEMDDVRDMQETLSGDKVKSVFYNQFVQSTDNRYGGSQRMGMLGLENVNNETILVDKNTSEEKDVTNALSIAKRDRFTDNIESIMRMIIGDQIWQQEMENNALELYNDTKLRLKALENINEVSQKMNKKMLDEYFNMLVNGETSDKRDGIIGAANASMKLLSRLAIWSGTALNPAIGVVAYSANLIEKLTHYAASGIAKTKNRASMDNLFKGQVNAIKHATKYTRIAEKYNMLEQSKFDLMEQQRYYDTKNSVFNSRTSGIAAWMGDYASKLEITATILQIDNTDDAHEWDNETKTLSYNAKKDWRHFNEDGSKQTELQRAYMLSLVNDLLEDNRYREEQKIEVDKAKKEGRDPLPISAYSFKDERKFENMMESKLTGTYTKEKMPVASNAALFGFVTVFRKFLISKLDQRFGGFTKTKEGGVTKPEESYKVVLQDENGNPIYDKKGNPMVEWVTPKEQGYYVTGVKQFIDVAKKVLKGNIGDIKSYKNLDENTRYELARLGFDMVLLLAALAMSYGLLGGDDDDKKGIGKNRYVRAFKNGIFTSLEVAPWDAALGALNPPPLEYLKRLVRTVTFQAKPSERRMIVPGGAGIRSVGEIIEVIDND